MLAQRSLCGASAPARRVRRRLATSVAPDTAQHPPAPAGAPPPAGEGRAFFSSSTSRARPPPSASQLRANAPASPLSELRAASTCGDVLRLVASATPAGGATPPALAAAALASCGKLRDAASAARLWLLLRSQPAPPDRSTHVAAVAVFSAAGAPRFSRLASDVAASMKAAGHARGAEVHALLIACASDARAHDGNGGSRRRVAAGAAALAAALSDDAVPCGPLYAPYIEAAAEAKQPRVVAAAVEELRVKGGTLCERCYAAALAAFGAAGQPCGATVGAGSSGAAGLLAEWRARAARGELRAPPPDATAAVLQALACSPAAAARGNARIVDTAWAVFREAFPIPSPPNDASLPHAPSPSSAPSPRTHHNKVTPSVAAIHALCDVALAARLPGPAADALALFPLFGASTARPSTSARRVAAAALVSAEKGMEELRALREAGGGGSGGESGGKGGGGGVRSAGGARGAVAAGGYVALLRACADEAAAAAAAAAATDFRTGTTREEPAGAASAAEAVASWVLATAAADGVDLGGGGARAALRATRPSRAAALFRSMLLPGTTSSDFQTGVASNAAPAVPVVADRQLLNAALEACFGFGGVEGALRGGGSGGGSSGGGRGGVVVHPGGGTAAEDAAIARAAVAAAAAAAAAAPSERAPKRATRRPSSSLLLASPPVRDALELYCWGVDRGLVPPSTQPSGVSFPLVYRSLRLLTRVEAACEAIRALRDAAAAGAGLRLDAGAAERGSAGAAGGAAAKRDWVVRAALRRDGVRIAGAAAAAEAEAPAARGGAAAAAMPRAAKRRGPARRGALVAAADVAAWAARCRAAGVLDTW